MYLYFLEMTGLEVIYLFIHLFVHLFIYSFIYLFIYLYNISRGLHL